MDKELTTAEKLLWLVENNKLYFIGSEALEIWEAYSPNKTFCWGRPACGDDEKECADRNEAIESAYKWAREQKC